MRLESQDGTFVALQVTSYECAGRPVEDDGFDWDANWLMIRGDVWDGFQAWRFHHPCLTTHEARELGRWLRGLRRARPLELSDPTPEGPDLDFTEPLLAFTLVAVARDVVTVDVSFEAEAWPTPRSPVGSAPVVRLGISQATLDSAIADWDAELVAFPVR